MGVERNERIVEAYLAGETMTAIGRSHGISRERVRQLIVRAGVTYRHRQQPTKVTNVCRGCAAGFYTSKGRERRYCSQECRTLSSNTVGRKCYEARQRGGVTWREIAWALDVPSAHVALISAKRYAATRNKEWPIKI